MKTEQDLVDEFDEYIDVGNRQVAKEMFRALLQKCDPLLSDESLFHKCKQIEQLTYDGKLAEAGQLLEELRSQIHRESHLLLILQTNIDFAWAGL